MSYKYKNNWNLFWSPPGEMSEDGCWVLIHHEYMYIGNTVISCLWKALTGWNADKHLVG